MGEVEPVTLVVGVLTALVGGGGVWAYFGAWGKNRNDLVTVAQDAAKAVIANLREEIERQDARIVELEAQDARCRADLAETRRELASVRDQLNLLI